MASSKEELPSSSGIFSDLKIWFSQSLPNKQWLIENAKSNGAQQVLIESQADIKIWDHLRKNPPSDVYSYEFITKSIAKGCREDLQKHYISSTSRVDRPVGSVVIASKGSRTRFTQADDQILYNWLTPFRARSGYYKGNEIYRKIEARYPHHTYQSWRDRYLKRVANANMTVTESIDAYEESDALVLQGDHPSNRTPPTALHASHTERLRQASPRSKALEDAESMRKARAPVINLPQQSFSTLEHDATTNGKGLVLKEPPVYTSSSHDLHSNNDRVSRVEEKQLQVTFEELSHFHGFTADDARRIFRAVPLIAITEPEKLHDCWSQMQEEYSSHTVEQWIEFYEKAMKPEFMRRKNLNSEEELRRYAAEWNVNYKQQTDIKAEQTSFREEDELERATSVSALLQPTIDEAQKTIRPSSSDAIDVAILQRGSHSADLTTIDNALTDEKEVPEMSAPVSPALSKSTNQANEGRKRSSQNTNSSTSQQPQSSQGPAQEDGLQAPSVWMKSHTSPETLLPGDSETAHTVPAALKKPMFGRTLHSSQKIESQNTTPGVRYESAGLGVQTSQLPRVSQEPPESGQRLQDDSAADTSQSTTTSVALSIIIPETLQTLPVPTAKEIDNTTARGTTTDPTVDELNPLSESSSSQESAFRKHTLPEAKLETIASEIESEKRQMWSKFGVLARNENMNNKDNFLTGSGMRPSTTTLAHSNSQSQRCDELEKNHKKQLHTKLKTTKPPSVMSGSFERAQTKRRRDSLDELPESAKRSANIPRAQGVSSTSLLRSTVSSGEIDHVVPSKPPASFDNDSLAGWLESLERSYKSTPPKILRALAITAATATTSNLLAAAILLSRMIASFSASEYTREQAFARMQKTHLFNKREEVSLAKAREFLPENMTGVWCNEDDRDLLSGDARKIEKVEAKHGETDCHRRIKWLEERFGA